DSSKLDIDHVVPLAEAWDSGAYRWDAARRRAFANDLGVSWSLIAVSAASNRSKGDKDPAEWLPPLASYRCQYLAVWVAIKTRWNLAVDAAEKSAIAGETECASTPVPTATPVGVAAPP
ncbi:MAG TPA: HNH endonuclease family protein, partial [Candidatus Limnocylindrales bacterium]